MGPGKLQKETWGQVFLSTEWGLNITEQEEASILDTTFVLSFIP